MLNPGLASGSSFSKHIILAAACTSVLLAITLTQFLFFDHEIDEAEWWKQPYQTDLDRGDGYPEAWPLELASVRVDVEESVHYALDSPRGFEEWSVMQQNIPGRGSVRLGSDRRAVILPMFHELHCVQSLWSGILGKGDARDRDSSNWDHHINHCLSYLRHWTLCRADMTLERGDFAQRNFTRDRIGAIHQCRDWRAVYNAAYSDWEPWVAYWISENLSNNIRSGA
ncbi:hypothetical protein HYPSUDRAFT_44660 [Hypholoma sublateritium FD-334 SS-4]|uniref:Oxidase ustYa n=1 Tax=Hypholoma sublateritium (strain FD-334 SS-4) TaxID=945553 RepID=A0A0D2PFT4_HYPSF|nr:hypothetical protein HYPSUDRAFT_44660 [Hypholoma sublateritium FD-334 SS-4]